MRKRKLNAWICSDKIIRFFNRFIYLAYQTTEDSRAFKSEIISIKKLGFVVTRLVDLESIWFCHQI